MHELSVTRSVLEIVLSAAGSAQVRRVDLEIGELTGVVDEYLVRYFALLAQGTVAEGADIRVERRWPEARCLDCGKLWKVRPPLPRCCDTCQGAVRFSGGDQLEVLRIEVDDGHSNPNGDP